MDGLQTLVDNEQISPVTAHRLAKLEPNTFCAHRSWGFGQVREWNLETQQVTIDFESKPGHVMGMEFAAESLTPLPTHHIYARRVNDLDAVKREAAETPIDLVRNVIESLGPSAIAENIEKALCPGVIPKNEWKKWWDAAKRAIRKDPRFTVPTAKTSPFKFEGGTLRGPISLKDAAQLKGLIPQLRAANELLSQADELRSKAGELPQVIALFDATLRKPPASQKADALKLALARDELAEIAGITPAADASTASIVVLLKGELPTILIALPSASQRRLLRVCREMDPDNWQSKLLRFLSVANGRLVAEIRDFFEEAGELETFREYVRRATRDQSLSSEALIWIFRNRTSETAYLIEPRLFAALIAAIEKDQIGERRSNRLHDLVMSDKQLLTDLLKDADLDAVRDITRGLMLTSVFDDMNRRSLLARIIKLYPEMQSLVMAPVARPDADLDPELAANSEPLVVSWESLEKRKAELDDLVSKKIPANTQEIAIARSYGDLRENAEFKFAKEQQRVLQRRRAELEMDIMRAKGTDFADADPSRVTIGTSVTIEGDTGGEESFTILGAWDSNPEHNVISYLTPLAKALHGKAPGESAEVPTDTGGIRTVTIRAIQRFVR